jgi:hypothetical protein
MRRGLTLVDLVVGLIVVIVAVLFLLPALDGRHCCHTRANGTKCANNLKQISLALCQYADDKRFYPHISQPKQLDGGWRSNTTSRVFRGLYFYNYDDNPETYVCPSSPDMFVPVTQAAKFDTRAFRWNGAGGPTPTLSPLVAGGEDASDLPLDQSTEISYGYTRRFLSTNSQARFLVAGDKSRLLDKDEPDHRGNMIGNHKDCQYVVSIDAHTQRLAPDGEGLDTRTVSHTVDPVDGFLGVLGDDPEQGR